MNEAAHLSDQLKRFLVDPHVPWTTSFLASIAGLSADQAAEVPLPGMNSVWAVTNHVWLWHDIVLKRLRHVPVDDAVARESGWSSLAAFGTDEEWRALAERTRSANAEIAAIVGNMRDEELDRPWATGRATTWQMIHGLIAHTSFHTGEILGIRTAQRTWPLPLQT